MVKRVIWLKKEGSYMSNEEKLKIERYRKRREKLIIFQASIIAVLSIVFFILLGAFNSVNQTTNIYTNFS